MFRHLLNGRLLSLALIGAYAGRASEQA